MARLRQALRDMPETPRVVVLSGQPRADHQRSLEDAPVGDAPAVVAVPLSDTVKEVVDGRVRRTVPRETIVRVVGPWIFDRQVLADALTRVAGREAQIADMMRLCDAAKLRVRVLSAR